MIPFSALKSIFWIAAILAAGLTGCATPAPEAVSDSAGMTVGLGTPVLAAAETPSVGTAVRDAADDPAIWVDPTNRTRGVIIGADKQAGLYVYDLSGAQVQYLPGGKPNNVDLRAGFATPAGERVLVAAAFLIASSQGDSAFAVWRVDGAQPDYRGRFSVVAAGGIDAVTGTDGVAALGGRAGPFPDGLVVVQDDVDEGATGARQNFKLVDWRDVRRALGL